MSSSIQIGSYPTGPVVFSPKQAQTSKDSQKRSFVEGGIQYEICLTAADGDCAIHAAAGTPRGDEKKYFFPNAREVFARTFLKMVDTPLIKPIYQKIIIDLLQQYFAPNPSAYAKMIFSDLDSEVAVYRVNLLKLQADTEAIKKQQREVFSNLLVAIFSLNKLDELIQIFDDENKDKVVAVDLEKLKNDAIYRYNRFYNNQQAVLKFLDTLSCTELTQEWKKSVEALKKIEQDREAIYNQIPSDKLILFAYCRVLRSSNYYISESEIELVALVFKKQIKVGTHSSATNAYTFRQPVGDKNHELVLIFHEGVHYSRCEKVGNAEKDLMSVLPPKSLGLSASSGDLKGKIGEQVSEIVPGAPSAADVKERAEVAVDKVPAKVPSSVKLDAFFAAYDYCQKALTENRWKEVEDKKHDLEKVVDEFNRSLIMVACENQHFALALILIKSGIGISKIDQKGNNAWHYVAKYVPGKEVGEFLEYLADAVSHHDGNTSGQLPFHVASENGNVDLMVFLAQNGTDVNAVCEYEFGNVHLTNVTALHLAIIKRQPASVDYLMDQSDFVWNTQISQIGNILHISIFFQCIDLLEDLLKKFNEKVKKCIDERNVEGLTPLMLCAHLDELIGIRILKEAGVKLEEKDNNGRKALHWAVRSGHANAIKLLCHFGAVVDSVDSRLQRPIDLAPHNSPLHALVENIMHAGASYQRQPPNFSLQPPENLVFKGGGPKGFAFVGALKVLEDRNLLGCLKRVAGSSAGAIQACLLSIGFNSKMMKDKMSETTFVTFLDNNIVQSNIDKKFDFSTKFAGLRTLFKHRNDIKKLFSKLSEDGGLCDGAVFLNWIENLIKAQTGIEWLTFGELRKLVESDKNKFKHLHVYTSNITYNRIEHISSESRQWDDFIISDAIRASMSIPIAFKPHKLHLKQDGRRVPAESFGMQMDGGITENLAIDTFDKRKCISDFQEAGWQGQGESLYINRRTLGFNLVSPPPLHRKEPTFNGLKDALVGVLEFYNNGEELQRAMVADNKFRVVDIDNLGVGLFDFNISKERIEALIASGFNSTSRFIHESTKAFPVGKGGLSQAVIRGKPAPKPDRLFAGRGKILEDLRNKLSIGAKEEKLIKFGLHGIKHIGKTEIAKKFAYDNCAAFSSISWIPCDDVAKTQKAYEEVARSFHLGLPHNTPLSTLRLKVHEYLEGVAKTEPFLLVFDGVSGLPPEMPKKGNGRILLTSENRIFPGKEDSIPVTAFNFNNDEGMAVLKSVVSESQRGTDEDMRALVKALDGYPPSVAQAASQISADSKMDVKKYLQGLGANGASKPLAVVSKAALQELRSTNPHAFKLLKVIEHYQGETFPICLLNFMDTMENKREKTVTYLQDRDLISIDEEEEMCSLQVSARYGVKESDAKDAEEFIIKAIVEIIRKKDCRNPKHEIYFDSLEAFMHSLLKLNKIANKQHEIEVRFGLARRIFHLGRYKEALAWTEEMMKTKNDEALPDSTFRLACENLLSNCRWRLGDFEGAFNHAKNVLQMTNDSGKELLPRAEANFNLGAVALKFDENWVLAKVYFTEALEIFEDLYKKKPNYETAKVHIYLGVVSGRLNDFNEARHHFNGAKKIFKTIFGEVSSIESAAILMHEAFTDLVQYQLLKKKREKDPAQNELRTNLLESAGSYVDLSLKMLDELDDDERPSLKVLKQEVLEIKGNVQFEKGKFGKAKESYEKALNATQTVDLFVVRMHRKAGDAILKMGESLPLSDSQRVERLNEAKRKYKEALGKIKKVQGNSKLITNERIACTVSLVKAYVALKRYQNAQTHIASIFELVTDFNVRREINELRAMFPK